MNNIFIETSNNVQINLKPASVSQRLLAYMLDLVFVFFFTLITSFVFGVFNNSGSSNILFYIIIGIPVFFYHLLFEIFNNGRSLGKMILKTRVVQEDGSSANIGNLILRWILRPVDNFFYGSVAILSIVITQKRQRLGDLAAGTMVVVHKQEVTLDELTQFLSKETYNPTYPNVHLLSQSQINTIKETLVHFKTNGNVETLNSLTLKVKSMLHIDSKDSNYKILYTIVKDFENLNN